MDWAFEYIKQNGGIDTEDDWGYYSGWGFGTWCNKRKLHDRYEAGCKRAGCKQVLYIRPVGFVKDRYHSPGVWLCATRYL